MASTTHISGHILMIKQFILLQPYYRFPGVINKIVFLNYRNSKLPYIEIIVDAHLHFVAKANRASWLHQSHQHHSHSLCVNMQGEHCLSFSQSWFFFYACTPRHFLRHTATAAAAVRVLAWIVTNVVIVVFVVFRSSIFILDIL